MTYFLRAAQKEIQEDLTEITEKYQLEQKGKIKLEEKLEASLVAAEQVYSMMKNAEFHLEHEREAHFIKARIRKLI